MRLAAVAMLFAPLTLAASDPATLHVNLVNERDLTFSLENHYQEPVTRYQVAVDFGGLECGMTIEVESSNDLRPNCSCGLPTDTKTGKVAKMNWKARLVYVEFADGMRWTPRF